MSRKQVKPPGRYLKLRLSFRHQIYPGKRAIDILPVPISLMYGMADIEYHQIRKLLHRHRQN